MANDRSTPNDRLRFPEIGPQAYEHPTDRAALVALRKVRGFETVLRRVFGALPERRLRLLYLANAVRVGPHQLPGLDRSLDEVCAILDLAKKPELFVVGDPRVNAMAVGLDAPFIVLNSSLLKLMDPDEHLTTAGVSAPQKGNRTDINADDWTQISSVHAPKSGNDGHFVLFDINKARTRMLQFFGSAANDADAVPTVVK